jgi:hypothetical protein
VTQSLELRPRRLRRRTAVLLLGLGAFGIAAASAASLGGLTSTGLGADNNSVSSCDTDGVNIAYTNTYDSTASLYKVSSVSVSGIDAACSGKSLSVTLSDNTGASIGTGTATVGGTSQVVSVSPTASAKAVVGAAAVITG